MIVQKCDSSCITSTVTLACTVDVMNSVLLYPVRWLKREDQNRDNTNDFDCTLYKQMTEVRVKTWPSFLWYGKNNVDSSLFRRVSQRLCYSNMAAIFVSYSISIWSEGTSVLLRVYTVHSVRPVKNKRCIGYRDSQFQKFTHYPIPTM